MKDIFEERREKIEKFSVETAILQSGLVRKLKAGLDEGIEDALNYAEAQVDGMKTQFMELFDELDELIRQKYTELEECASDQEKKEAELKKNRKLLSWIEACRAEIDEILNI